MTTDKECDNLFKEIIRNNKLIYKDILIDFSALETRADELDYSLDKIEKRLTNIEKKLDK